MRPDTIVRALVSAVQATDRDQPDERCCAAAIDRLNDVFGALRAGLNPQEVGLGKCASAALAELRAQLFAARTHGSGDAPGIFAAVPLDLIHEAIVSAHLPNRDRALLDRLRDPLLINKGLPPDRKRADERLQAKLQWCTITLAPDLIRLRNRVDDLECEVSTPALLDHGDPGQGAVAFTFPFHVMWELFDRVRCVPRLVSWGRETQRKQLILFHYDPDEGLLEIFYGATRLNCSVEPLPAPEPALSSLTFNGPRRIMACDALADALRWVLRLGSGASNVLHENRQVVADYGSGQISYTDESIDAGELVIGALVAKSLRYAFTRMGGNAEIRTDGDHHFIQKGVATLAFAAARADHRDYKQIEERIRTKGACITVTDSDLLPALGIANATGAGTARLEVLVGAHPQLRLTALGRDEWGFTFKAVTYVPIGCVVDAGGLTDCAFDISLPEWLHSIGFQEDKSVEIIVSDDQTGVLLTHQHGLRRVTGLFAAAPSQSEPHEWDARMVADGRSTTEPEMVEGSGIGDLLVLATSGGQHAHSETSTLAEITIT